MRQKTVLAFGLLFGMFCGVQQCIAQASLGGSPASVTYNPGPDTWFLGTPSASSYVIYEDSTFAIGSDAGVIWSITTPGVVTYNSGAPLINLSGPTASFGLDDSLGGSITGSLMWDTVFTDPSNSNYDDIVGTIADLNFSAYTPAFQSYFSGLSDGGPAYIILTVECSDGPCLSAATDPTGDIVGVGITGTNPLTQTSSAAPEPGTLGLVGSGLPMLYYIRRRLFRR